MNRFLTCALVGFAAAWAIERARGGLGSFRAPGSLPTFTALETPRATLPDATDSTQGAWRDMWLARHYGLGDVDILIS